MTHITDDESHNTESKLPLSKFDLLYCFVIILIMLSAFDLMGNFIFFFISFMASIGFTYTEADIPLLNLILNLGAQTAVVISFLILYKLRRIEPEDKTPLKGNHLITTYALYALNLAFAFFIIVNIDSLLKDTFGLSTASPYEGIEPTLALLENPLFVPLFLAVLMVGASVSEELVFRRALIPMLERRGLGQAWVLLISSILFSLRHTPADYLSGSLGFAIVHVFGTMSGGLILGYLYLRTRNILWPILLHALINGVIAFSQISITIFDEGVGNGVPLLVSGLWALMAIGFGLIVFFYAVIQLLTKRDDMKKPIWLQIITDVKIRTVKLSNILILSLVFIFFSGGIDFLFDFVWSILESSGMIEGTSLAIITVLLEITYYIVFLVVLSLFVFRKTQPIAKPIFVSTIIYSETKYSPPSTFIRRPAYQQSSGKLCESCGNAIIPGSKFCAFCGVQHSSGNEEPSYEI